MRQLRVSDGSAVWDDLEGMSVVSLPAKFRMPNIERGLWTDSSLGDVKGKKPFRGQDQLMPRAPHPTYDQTYMPQTLAFALLCHPGHGETSCFVFWPQDNHVMRHSSPARPTSSHAMPRVQQTSALFCFEDTETVFTVRYVVEPDPSETYRGSVDQGLVHLGQPSVTTNPLPTHTTHAVPPLADSMHSIDFVEFDDYIHMLSWDDSEPEPIVVDEVRAPYVDDIHTSDIQKGQERGRQDFEVVVEHSGSHFHMKVVSIFQYSPRCIDSSLEPNQSYRVPSIILDNGLALNVCPLAIAIALGYALFDIVVLDMMRSMSYIPSMGLGRCQHEPRAGEAQLTHTSFDYLVRPYTMSLADYFVRASEPRTHSNGIIEGFSTTQEAELQHLVHQLQLSDRSLGTSTSVLTASPSPDRTSLMMLYFPDEIDEHRTFAEIGGIVDGVVPHDEYVDEMLAMSLSQTEETTWARFTI
ncbi:hypothetical protein CK203_042130 [Vitis vinifera]|uniref:Uncharacterized protein n=1 Tax=Vitis vinifera TaxID=29760 RepID=A0A438HQ00_VITVI|nr:hypothetical protein CK203_042130 [Vitis vinifera]